MSTKRRNYTEFYDEGSAAAEYAEQITGESPAAVEPIPVNVTETVQTQERRSNRIHTMRVPVTGTPTRLVGMDPNRVRLSVDHWTGGQVVLGGPEVTAGSGADVGMFTRLGTIAEVWAVAVDDADPAEVCVLVEVLV